MSRAYSRGRNGYGKEYKLKVSPDLIGPAIDKEYFDSLVNRKARLDRTKAHQKRMKSLGKLGGWGKYANLFGNL